MDELKRKVTAGLVRFFIFLGLLLFIPGWSLLFWQGWIFWIIFSGITLWLTLYFLKNDPKLIERRMKAGPGAEKEPSQKAIQAFTGTFAFALAVVPGLDFRFHWSSVPLFIVAVSDLFVVLGYLIMFFVFKVNSYTSSIIEVDSSQKVVSTGPYALVRHPMYSGGVLMFIFTPMALGSYWALICSLFLIAGIIARLINEEKFLLNNLAGYPEYYSKVRYRLIPKIW